jgi:Domain of unknown function (DUF4272)
MAQENCILLSNSRDFAQVATQLLAAFGSSAVTIEGDEAAWTQITVTRRKLLGKAQATFVVLDDPKLVEIQKRLRHVYLSVTPEIPGLHTKLLAKIATSRLAIEVQAPKGLRGLEEVVFEVSSALDAVIFWEGSKMLNKKGELVMDFEGKSGVGELEVTVDAADYDAQRTVTDEGLARKARSEKQLNKRLIPLNKNLPLVAPEAEVQLRTVEAVAQRALALMLVAAKGEGLEQEIVALVMADYGIEPLLSPDELAFIQNADPSQQDRVNFCWRYESLAVMLWALGYQAKLEYPEVICDVPGSIGIIQESGSYAGFLAGARLRSAAEILDQNDLTYRMHWAVVDARLRGQEAPSAMLPGVVYERHYALNWLIAYQDSDWDDVGTDT